MRGAPPPPPERHATKDDDDDDLFLAAQDGSAALDAPKLPHALEIADAPLDPDDASVCHLHPKTAESLGLMAGDTVRIRGKRDHETLCTLAEAGAVAEGHLGLASGTRANLRLTQGGVAKIYRCDNARSATLVQLVPFGDATGGLTSEELREAVFSPHFFAADGEGNAPYRPLHEGDRITLRHGAQLVEVKVALIEPARRAIVVPETELEVLDETLDRAEEDEADSEFGYEDIGGCDKQLAKIRELVELPMKHPEVFTRVGVRPPRGVLIHGPPGCGKTMIARAVAAETGAACFLINGPQVMSQGAGESEQNLREAFEEAEANSPAIIFIDEIDSIAPRRDKTQGDAERRLVSQLLTLMDGIKPTSQVVLMAATSRPNAIDPGLRRFGRFDLEISIPVPDEAGRTDILRIKSRELRLSPEVDVPQLARDTQGYCGADLAQVAFEAAMECVREKMGEIEPHLDADAVPQEVLDSLVVQPSHVARALQITNPSTLRESAIEVPNVSWKDIGGLEDVKRELRETVQYPVQYASKFEHFGMSPSKGVLFYGPPGCGKTLLAKAIANECNANFISVKGPELLTMWFGESEANVRELFDKARQAAPCVIFFDEMDSIAKARGGGGGGASEAGDRVINQILTEIDGVGSRKNVFVIGATNRPDILDPAIMRPGRLDQLIYIPLPDYESRLSILKATLRKSPLGDDINLDAMANATEGFSGADLTEICQRACKLAIREEIAAQEAAEAEAEAAGKPPPEPKLDGTIGSRFFKESMANARRSVSKKELARYNSFRKQSAAGLGAAAAAKAGAAEASADTSVPGTEAAGDDAPAAVDEADLYG